MWLIREQQHFYCSPFLSQLWKDKTKLFSLLLQQLLLELNCFLLVLMFLKTGCHKPDSRWLVKLWICHSDALGTMVIHKWCQMKVELIQYQLHSWHQIWPLNFRAAQYKTLQDKECSENWSENIDYWDFAWFIKVGTALFLLRHDYSTSWYLRSR